MDTFTEIADFLDNFDRSEVEDALAIINLPTFKVRPIVSYYDLSEAWQKEADSNHDELAKEISYFEPEDDQEPSRHILWDLSGCMRSNDSDFDGAIGISNNSAMAVKLSDCGETAYTWILG